MIKSHTSSLESFVWLDVNFQSQVLIGSLPVGPLSCTTYL